MSGVRAPLLVRLMAKVDVNSPGGCWIWQGTANRGYGRIGRGRKAEGMEYTHRVAYRLFVGPIPEGLTIDHVKARGCTSTLCCNPAHLEAVTQAENTARGSALEVRRAMFALITECPAGHPYSEENTRVSRAGSRQCRACDRARHERRKTRIAESAVAR